MVSLNPTQSELVVWLRQVMRRRHYTMKRLANEIGVSSSTLAERFNSCYLRLSDVIDICNTLGVDLMWRER